MKEYLLTQGYQSFQLRLAEQSYYSWKLEERSKFLGSLTAEHLCKSMIMENKKFNPELESEFYS